jgi:predicted nucleic acid-binding protein
VTFVLDASTAACWCYHDEEDARADAAYDRLATDQAIVPAHWWFELRNVLLTGERRKRISAQHNANFLRQVALLPIEIDELPSEGAVFELARKHALTFYDAAYLELAQRLRIALATLDSELVSAAAKEGVELVGR